MLSLDPDMLIAAVGARIAMPLRSAFPNRAGRELLPGHPDNAVALRRRNPEMRTHSYPPPHATAQMEKEWYQSFESLHWPRFEGGFVRRLTLTSLTAENPACATSRISGN